MMKTMTDPHKYGFLAAIITTGTAIIVSTIVLTVTGHDAPVDPGLKSSSDQTILPTPAPVLKIVP